MAEHTIDVSVRGKWFSVPALTLNGKDTVVRGRWVRTAVIEDEEWLETEIDDPEQCIKTLKAQKSKALRADIFTFAQKLPATRPKYNYPVEWESVAAMRTANFKEWWEKLPQETRKNVRRSQKRGVTTVVKAFDDELIKGIMGVNDDSPTRQGIPYAHYGKSFEQVRKDHSSFLDRCDFVCAYVGDEMIGFLKLVYRGEIAAILQLTPKPSHQDKRPGNALLAKAVERCQEKGISHLIYGMYNYGNKRDSPLREFKVRNGFEEILMPRFYVPLTVKGWLWVKLKLYRGLLGILPPSMIAAGLSARAKLYSLKQSTSRCSSMPERPNSDRQMAGSNPPAGSNP